MNRQFVKLSLKDTMYRVSLV